MHSDNIVSVLLHGITFISPAQTASSKFIYYSISRMRTKISRLFVLLTKKTTTASVSLWDKRSERHNSQ